MLREVARGNPVDAERRWFSDPDVELIVWYKSADRAVEGFQLCYDRRRQERALTWKEGRGFLHEAVDSGEESPTANRTPVLVADGEIPIGRLRRLFAERSLELEPAIRELVSERLAELV